MQIIALKSNRYLFVAAVSKEDSDDQNHGKLPYNGYSDEFLDRLEPNGNIPPGKGDIRYGKLIFYRINCSSVFAVTLQAKADI